MSKILTPQEALQAIIDGKKLECKWHTNNEWSMFNPLNNGVVIECVYKSDYIFRLAQEMISINDVSFPKPESKPPKTGTTYYYPEIRNASLINCLKWDNHPLDLKFLKANMVHLTTENAIAHAKALIVLSGGNVDE